MTVDEPLRDATEPLDTPPAETAAANPQRGLRTAVMALAALSFGLAVLSAWLVSSRDSDHDVAARRAAGGFASAFLTYDYHRVDAWKRNVSTRMTGALKKDFDSRNAAVSAIFVERKNESTVTDIEVFLSEVDGDSATAFAIVDTVLRTDAGPPTPLTAYLRMDLIHTGNGWLVDGLTNLNLGAAPAAGNATTSSTVPANRR